ncbi:MAG: hypothetical protein A2849_01980 [Candidatus Taylorbacteria bacterium RIFCSPHIGHO2_01_FULL_51_15]|uniref:Uncharacterized protein n=1 Tax=Candidatus Taylorbacteria bacterium RIFCSPHIGHO2_01_FULL_51_15 TaxID=1802304 RepID=A0A1G2MAG2_9BACT|nr:MAG: hypothetical protein A2849_01980 [Candidatus Taylorbacteria bacterium RIFCSPHIGHO2_01_FULL_51_15]
MFNLLPKAEKIAIRREYRVRLVIIILWSLFVTCSIASILLLPSYLLSSQKEEAAEKRFETLLANAQRTSGEDPSALLSDAKSRLELLSHKAPDVFLHDVVVQTASLKTERISLTGISFSDAGEKGRQIGVTGVAKDRSALLTYVKALEHSGLFKSVEVPISNFAKDVDIDFSLRATASF